MSHFTLKLNSDQFMVIQKYYQKELQTQSNSKTIAFFVKSDKNMITVYRNGTLLVQGSDAFSKILFLQKLLQTKPLNEKKNTKSYYLESIGSDEVGTGDVFGPIIVCSVYIPPQNITFFQKKIFLSESKQMLDKNIIQTVPLIMDKVIKTIVTLKPSKYNKLIVNNNLNKIKALMHNLSILQTVEKINKAVPVILDQFCLPKLYFNYLKDETSVYQKINFQTKADSNYLSVAVASLIARYYFLKKMNQLNHQLDCKLYLGAGERVDRQIASIVEKHGNSILKNIAKCNFKNITHKFQKYLTK
ncbi:Ribonuclease HII family protein [Candidatus Phytoplasma australiense]|uniref:Ribonuclease n=1 Tax=Phytoplasma australiense TaxID=59748 RepID=B1VAR8_PHYAS|nr:Ribonuclease HII family protein [Candidatus Phytoplasma australiense]